METIYYFLPIIIALGIITSYEDLKFGRIRNKWITLSILASIIINILIIFGLGKNINENYYIYFLINIFMALIIAFTFFYFDMWSAGDGKLFFAYATLLPLTSYSNDYLAYFPSFSFLVNIFLPYIIYIIIKLLIRFDIDFFRKTVKKFFSENIFFSIFKLFSITWLVGISLSKIGVTDVFINYSISLFINMYALRSIERKYKVGVYYASIILSALRLVLDNTIYSLNFLFYFIIFIAIYQIIFRSLILSFIMNSSIDYVKPKMLKKGMSLAFTIIKTKDSFAIDKKNSEKRDRAKIFMQHGKILEEMDIDIIKGKKIMFDIPVYKKIPFAHLMFLGVVLTLLLKGNILIYLLNLF